MDKEFEALISSCNSISQIRQVSHNNIDIVPAILDCVEPVKILLASIFQRLELKGKKFRTYSAANE